MKKVNSKKGPGIEKIPTKLVKLASDILAEPLSIAINNSISTSTFPNNAKIASVVPVDKKTDDKYVISNFRPVSIFEISRVKRGRFQNFKKVNSVNLS